MLEKFWINLVWALGSANDDDGYEDNVQILITILGDS